MGKTPFLHVMNSIQSVYIETLQNSVGWVGRRAGGGCPALVRSSHFNIETSASLNSGFNVLEALRFLIQLLLFFVVVPFIYTSFFLYAPLKMSFDFPQVPSCSRWTANLWHTEGGVCRLERRQRGVMPFSFRVSLGFPLPFTFV